MDAKSGKGHCQYEQNDKIRLFDQVDIHEGVKPEIKNIHVDQEKE